MTPFQHTEIVINHIRQKSDVIICMYSGGKDSLVLLDLLSKNFKTVHACFMYLVKDLDHQKPLLQWAEKHYNNVIIHQYPHWMLSHYLKNGHMTFHKGNDDVAIIKAAHIEDNLRSKIGEKAWIASGERRADNLKRYMFLGMQKFDAIAEGRQHIYPLSHWKKNNVERYLKIHRIIAPCNYNPKANSNGVDLDIHTLLFLRDKYPSDLEKLLKVFPFAGKILFEHDYEQNSEYNEAPKI